MGFGPFLLRPVVFILSGVMSDTELILCLFFLNPPEKIVGSHFNFLILKTNAGPNKNIGLKCANKNSKKKTHYFKAFIHSSLCP